VDKKRKPPKGSHIVKEHIAKNPKHYKSLGERFDEKLKKGFKNSGLW
jgi:hypothetical protein